MNRNTIKNSKFIIFPILLTMFFSANEAKGISLNTIQENQNTYIALAQTEASSITAKGKKLSTFLDNLDVEHLWLAGNHIDWKTGEKIKGKSSGTFCSAFASAVAFRLNVKLLSPPEHSLTLLANAQQDWLKENGSQNGWQQLKDDVEAQDLANKGYLVLASYKNPNPEKSGHIAIVRPYEKNIEDIKAEGPEIIQAGQYNYNSTSLKQGFNQHKGAFENNEILFFAHEIDDSVMEPSGFSANEVSSTTLKTDESFQNAAESNILEDKNEFMLYDAGVLNNLKDKANRSEDVNGYIEKIIKSANSYLKQKPLSVTQKSVSEDDPTYHEYVSMAIYYWPDPSKEDGKPYINKDGQVNPEKNDNDKYDAARYSKTISAVNTLSLAYYLTGNEEYAKHSAELLRAWFLNPDTRMNPNLDYGQLVPGKNTGSSSGIIDTSNLITIIDAVNMLKQSENFTAADNEELKKWFSDYVDWLTQSKFGKKEGETTNNHGVWYDAQVAAFAYYAGREDVSKQVIEVAKLKRINKQIEKDGSMPRELARTRSMDYTMYNLEAFTTLAQIGDKVGVDLWNYSSEDGKSIKLAFSYLYPYLQDKSKWEHQNIVQENDRSFAPYLAIAAEKLKIDDYGKVAAQLLTKDAAKENIIIYCFSNKE